jgi:hypothetical protein
MPPWGRHTPPQCLRSLLQHEQLLLPPRLEVVGVLELVLRREIRNVAEQHVQFVGSVLLFEVLEKSRFLKVRERKIDND